MERTEKGFTLIELMIVLAIVGILAAIAIPMYLDYSVRSQVSHGLSMASGAKASVTEYYQNRGAFPGDNATAGVSAPGTITGKYVSQVEVVAGGLIQVTYGVDANNKIFNAVLTMTPADNLGAVAWSCTGDATLVAKWLPPACRP